MSKKITLLKSGNRVVVSPTTDRIRDLLEPQLTYTARRFLFGWERRQAKMAGRPVIELSDIECFGSDHRNRLGFAFGFWKRVTGLLKGAGYQVIMRDLVPPKDPTVFEPQWERLKEFDVELRDGQPEFLRAFFSHRCGCFDCPPGFGKSHLIGVIGLLLPKARIDVVSKRVAVVRDRIYPELCQMLPNVGIVGGGVKNTGRRVMCYTIDSSHHSKGDSDILLLDEVHELAADKAAYRLGAWDMSRNYGMSASVNKRLDGKDMRIEGICGPTILKIEYRRSQKAGSVVPIEVRWTPVIMDIDPADGEDDLVRRKRFAYWTNDYRNDLIAKDAREFPDLQTLICVETIEHAVQLKSRLPEFKLVYMENGMSVHDRNRYIDMGLITSREPRMTFERKLKLTRRFEAGKLRKAIVTTVWNVGVNFRHLGLLIRADGGGSPINDTQIPGRVSRPGPGKQIGIVRDYMDQFNRGCRMRAKGRQRSYTEHGWEQCFPEPSKPRAFWLGGEQED